MPSIGNARNIDDARIHLQQILNADAARQVAYPAHGELHSAETASVLPVQLRVWVEEVLAALRKHASELSAAEAAKFSASRAVKHALGLGVQALARVDSHLHAVTREREPLVGRSYGVYGANPRTVAGVLRALTQSQAENARIKALAPSVTPGAALASVAEGASALPGRALLFTPVVEAAINEALHTLQVAIGDRFDTRAELSRQVRHKLQLSERAVRCIAAVRNHLYANLPLRKRDPDLRDYGFRPVRRRAVSNQDVARIPVSDPVRASAATDRSITSNGNVDRNDPISFH